MSLPFLAYLLAALALSPAHEDISLSARRSCSRSDAPGRTAIEVELRLRNEGERTICAIVSDPLLPGMDLRSGSLSRALVLRPGGEGELRYGFEAARGRFEWKRVDAAIGDPFGLTEIELGVEAPATIVVRPRLAKLRRVSIRPWMTLPAPGLVPTRAGGSGTDFFGLREYRPGDPLKSLDWRRAAGRPGMLLTREYVQERTADIALILDARKQSEVLSGDRSLLELEVEAAASLAEMFLRQGQRLCLFVAGGGGTGGGGAPRALPDYGTVQLRRVLDCLAAVGRGQGRDSARARRLDDVPVHHLPRGALAIVISPIEPDDLLFFRRLRALAHQVLLICPDALDFAGPAGREEWPEIQARRAFALERRLTLGRIAQMSVSVLDWRPGQPIESLVRAVLSRPMAVRRV